MKKIMIAVVLFLCSAIALALPKPSQIEDALAAGKYADARNMVQEVLREKPDSARAHLMNAYLLAHVDRNAKAAATELNAAASLDKKGDVKSSPLFGRVAAEIEAIPQVKAAPPAPKAQPIAAPAQPQKESASMYYWMAVLGFVAALLFGAIWWIMRDKQQKETLSVPPTDENRSAWGIPTSPVPPSPGQSQANTYPPRYYAPPNAFSGQFPPPPQREPMGAFGTAASVAGGVVAGNLISDVIRHSTDDSARRRREEQRREEERRSNDDFFLQQQLLSSSGSSSSDVSYRSSRSSFSSSSSGSDSWGSSSSSSDSGSSSSDSGSSGGDW